MNVVFCKSILIGRWLMFLPSAQDSSTDEAPIFLEAPRIAETNLSEEDPDQEQRAAGIGNGTQEEETAQPQSSDNSIRQRHGPWMRL